MDNGRDITFLFADDDSDDRFLFEEALIIVAPDAKLITAHDGQDVFRILMNRNSLPDLIFLDINMPGMDGWECLSAITSNESYKSIPVIIYSTTSRRLDIDRAYKSGAFCFCTKPDNFNNLKFLLKLIYDNIDNDLKKALNECVDCTSVYFPGNDRYSKLMD